MPFTSNPPFWDRIVDSYAASQASYAARVAAGTQPPITLVGTNLPTVITWNVAYFAVIGTLYFIMSRREEDFKKQLKPFIVVYNAICVYLAAYVVYGLFAWKWENPDGLVFVCNDGYVYNVIYVYVLMCFWYLVVNVWCMHILYINEVCIKCSCSRKVLGSRKPTLTQEFTILVYTHTHTICIACVQFTYL